MARKVIRERKVLVNVHRFRDTVAVYAAHDDGTIYLSAKDAREFAESILTAVSSIETEKFVDSNVPSYTLNSR